MVEEAEERLLERVVARFGAGPRQRWRQSSRRAIASRHSAAQREGPSALKVWQARHLAQECAFFFCSFLRQPGRERSSARGRAEHL
eukprot:2609100-Pyramimonas_sp.AAC.1